MLVLGRVFTYRASETSHLSYRESEPGVGEQPNRLIYPIEAPNCRYFFRIVRHVAA